MVFSSAITSATLIGVAAAGYQALTSTEAQNLLNHVMIKAGTWFVENYVNVGFQMVDRDLDHYMALGDAYLRSL